VQRRDQLVIAMELDSAPLRELVRPGVRVAGVPAGATVARIREVSRESGHLRLVVGEAGERPVGVVHVRDTLTRPAQTTAADLMRPVLTLSGNTPVHAALSAMRAGRNHLALVEVDGGLLGIVTIRDVLDRLLPAA